MGRRRRRAATEGSVMNGADLADLGHVHIVGIGGAGMSGIASILAARGVHVTGSDAKESRRVQSLRALGIEVSVGHQKSITADTLVYSTAIPESNSERRFARRAFDPRDVSRHCPGVSHEWSTWGRGVGNTREDDDHVDVDRHPAKRVAPIHRSLSAVS